MKQKTKTPTALTFLKTAAYRKANCYFHADEDFREDWEWGNAKSEEMGNKINAAKTQNKSIIKSNV
nr:hypothetical protein [Pedobacter panaciterrae]